MSFLWCLVSLKNTITDRMKGTEFRACMYVLVVGVCIVACMYVLVVAVDIVARTF